MSLENNNILVETLLETRVSQQLLKSEKTEDLLIDTFSKMHNKKKSLVPISLPLVSDRKMLQPILLEEPEKLNMNGPFRKDAFGNVIKKRNKAHKLKFREDPFVEIISVENWKKYNMLEDKPEEKTTCNCNCSII
jgi:hypothetical protein